MRPEEAALIARFLEGENGAIAEVDGWLRQAAWPFRRRLGDGWEDALQDVRLEVTRLLQGQKFRGESTLKTYLWRVTSNACVDRVRAQQKVRWEDLEAVDFAAEAPREVRDRNFRTEAMDLALRVLAQMSEECKRLWRMVLEGLSYAEMSRRTGVSEGALRVRVLRCRKRAIAVRDELLEAGAAPAG